jgi:hypothetical protein
LARQVVGLVDGWRWGEGGEFFGGNEPDFKGAIQGAVGRERDVGNAAVNDGLKAVVVFGRGGRFLGEVGLVPGGWQAGAGRERRGEGAEVFVIRWLVRWRGRQAGGLEMLDEGIKELGQAAAADLMKDFGLGEIFEVRHNSD